MKTKIVKTLEGATYELSYIQNELIHIEPIYSTWEFIFYMWCLVSIWVALFILWRETA